jgi:hypothetical protein
LQNAGSADEYDVDDGYDSETRDRLADALPAAHFGENDPMLRTLAGLAKHPAAGVRAPNSAASVYNHTVEVQDALDFAAGALRSVKQIVQPREPVPDKGAALHINYDAFGRAFSAEVSVIEDPGQEPSRAARTIVNAGEAMPYIRLPQGQRPSQNTTIELHNLSEEQAFTFKLTMEPLQRHMDGEQDVPQLKMSVLGNAGERAGGSAHRDRC